VGGPIGAQNDALCGHQGSRIHARDSAIGSLRRTVLVALRNPSRPSWRASAPSLLTAIPADTDVELSGALEMSIGEHAELDLIIRPMSCAG